MIVLAKLPNNRTIDIQFSTNPKFYEELLKIKTGGSFQINIFSAQERIRTFEGNCLIKEDSHIYTVDKKTLEHTIAGSTTEGKRFITKPIDLAELLGRKHWLYEEDWDKKYTVDESIDSEEFGEGSGRLETYGDDLALAKEINERTPNKVWTMVEGDSGLSLMAGFHFVNRIYYVITNENWENNSEDYFLSEDIPEED